MKKVWPLTGFHRYGHLCLDLSLKVDHAEVVVLIGPSDGQNDHIKCIIRVYRTADWFYNGELYVRYTRKMDCSHGHCSDNIMGRLKIKDDVQVK
jgi:hypothetical protein